MAHPSLRRAGAAAAAVLALAGGCGLRADDEPVPISRELDPSLFQDTGDGQSGTYRARIYVLSSSARPPRLVGLDVHVPSNVGYERAVLEKLLRWLPDTVNNGRLRTLIPSGTTLRDVHRDGEGVLTVDLANLTIEGPGQAQALAQIVYTATDIAGIDFVRFAIDGKSVAVPLEQRSAPPGSRLARRDFAELEPEQPPPPPATNRTGETTTTSTATTTATAPTEGSVPP